MRVQIMGSEAMGANFSAVKLDSRFKTIAYQNFCIDIDFFETSFKNFFYLKKI